MELNMNKKIIVNTLPLLFCSFCWAEVSPHSYTFLNISYFNAEVVDEDFDGLGISGSIAVADQVFLIGSVAQLESDDEFNVGFGPDQIEYQQYTIGAGFYLPVAELIDFVGTLQFAEVELEYQGFSEDGNGYVASAGLRAKASEALEINGAINYADIEGGGETGFSFGALFYASTNIALGASYSNSDDVDAISLHVRFDN